MNHVIVCFSQRGDFKKLPILADCSTKGQNPTPHPFPRLNGVFSQKLALFHSAKKGPFFMSPLISWRKKIVYFYTESYTP